MNINAAQATKTRNILLLYLVVNSKIMLHFLDNIFGKMGFDIFAIEVPMYVRYIHRYFYRNIYLYR